MELIDGKKIAAQVKQELADEVKRMKAAGAKTPHLVAVLVGNDPANLCGQQSKGLPGGRFQEHRNEVFGRYYRRTIVGCRR